MRLVFLSSLVPVKQPKSGFDIANKTIVDGLREIGVEVKIIGFLTPGEQAAYPDDTIILDELEVTNTKVGKWQKIKWLIKAITNGTPVSVGKMLQASKSEIHDSLEQLKPYDGLVFNSVQLPGAFLDLFQNDHSIFVAHNVESHSAAKNADAAGNIITKVLFNREASLLEKLEQRLCSSSDHVWTLSEQDRHGLQIVDKSSFLPLVTSTKLSAPAPSQKPEYDLGMIGSWSWAANRQGLDWFFEDVLPLLPADFKIAVAGNIGDVPPSVAARIDFLGRVPDAIEFTNSCHVIPLISREGTGVQLKTLETFELGLPCVATTSSIRGIDNIPSNCAIHDDGRDFAQAIIQMVMKIRNGEDQKIDGKLFHQEQLAQLLSALKFGIKQIKS